jgi:hypothetical protein
MPTRLRFFFFILGLSGTSADLVVPISREKDKDNEVKNPRNLSAFLDEGTTAAVQSHAWVLATKALLSLAPDWNSGLSEGLELDPPRISDQNEILDDRRENLC